MLGSGALSPGGWEGVVSVREDLALTEELTQRLRAGSGRKAVGVTDLVSLRPAFYKLTAPGVPVPAARQARLDQGRALHQKIGLCLSGEGILEARVRRDGLVGRIDILSDLPVEVKTASSLVEPERLAASRPEQLDQLAMYCALLARPTGRLLTVHASPTSVSDVQVLDVTFGSHERVLLEMQRRAEQLRDAWKNSRVNDLPRCPWFGRGCEFEEAEVCVCTGEEPAASSPFAEVEGLAERDDLRERLRLRLSGEVGPRENDEVGRFRDLLYPRRTYFDRTAPRPPSRVPVPAVLPAPDLYSRVIEALESGPAGEVARLPTPSDAPDEEVVGFRGRPLLVRTSRARSEYGPAELLARAPQYALELGLRCAVAGAGSGLVVLGHERPARPDRPVRAFDIRFESLTPFSRLFRERRRAIATAVRDRAPASLPACPRWMAVECPYRSECGCEGDGSRVSR